MEAKQRVKLYKSGKLWVTAMVGAVAIVTGVSSANADSVNNQTAASPKTEQVDVASTQDVNSNVQEKKQGADDATQQVNSDQAGVSSNSVTSVQSTPDSNSTENSQAKSQVETKQQKTETAPTAEVKPSTTDEKAATNNATVPAKDNSQKTSAAENKTSSTTTPSKSQATTKPDNSKQSDADNTATDKVKPDGWYGNQYIQAGKPLTGMQKISGKWYLFNKKGQATAGLYTNGKSKQYYQKDFSQLRNKQLKLNRSTIYYFGKDGNAITGLRQYTDKKGVKHVEAYSTENFKQIQNAYFRTNSKSLYFFDIKGQAVKGLRKYTDKKKNKQLEAYSTKTFKQIRNGYFKTNSGKNVYYLGKNGDAIKGMRKYTEKKGVKHIEAYSKKTMKQLRNTYYKTNAGKSVYYLGKKGQAVKGARYVGKNVEYYGSNFKRLKNSWKTFNNTQYYFGSKGIATKAFLNYRYFSQLNQGAPEGCEGASMQIALSHKGRAIPSLPSIYNKLGHGYNVSPHKGFYGNPFGGGGYKTETVFADALSKTFKKQGAVNLTGATVNTIVRELNHSNAVVTWADYYWRLTGHHAFHVMTIVGYTANSFLVADPYSYSAKAVWVSKGTWSYINKNTRAIGFNTPRSMNMAIR